MRFARLRREPTASAASSSEQAFDTYDVADLQPVGAWYIKNLIPGASCSPAPPGLPPAYATGNKIARTELVAGHLETVETGRRLSAVMIRADDGSRQRVSWYDTALRARCALHVDFDAIRCGPLLTSIVEPLTEVYGDPACTAAVASVADPVPNDALVSSRPIDRQRFTYFRIGEAPPQLFQRVNGACTPTALLYASGTIRIAQTIPSASLPWFSSRTIERNRLAVTVFVDNEGTTEQFPIGITEQRTKRSCSFMPTSDGDTRCVPEADPMRFGDSRCSAENAFATLPVPSRAGPPRPVAAWSGDDCRGGFDLFELGTPLPSSQRPRDVYDRGRGGSCARDSLASSPYSSLAFHAIGSAIPSITFERAVLIAE